MLCSTTHAPVLARATTNGLVNAVAVADTTVFASAHAQPKTRVWGFDQNCPLNVCANTLASTETHRGISSTPCETVSAFSHAAEGTTLVESVAPETQATMIGQEVGPSIIVPQGATGPVLADNGLGVKYVFGEGGPGLSDSVSGLRIMDPTAPFGPSPGYPFGYASYFNAAGQTINPVTGQTVARISPWWHIPLGGD